MGTLEPFNYATLTLIAVIYNARMELALWSSLMVVCVAMYLIGFITLCKLSSCDQKSANFGPPYVQSGGGVGGLRPLTCSYCAICPTA